MKRFEVTAIRTDRYIIELDETKFDENWRKEWAEVFFQLDDLKAVAENLAFQQLRNGDTRFFEGFGNVLRDGQLPFSRSDYDEKGKLLPEDQRDKPAEGINIIIDSEDDDYEFEITEVTNG